MNPTGKKGKPMECYVTKPDGQKCGPVYPLAKNCPHRQGSAGPSSGKGNTTSTHLAIEDWETEYVQTFEELFYVRVSYDSDPYVPFGSSQPAPGASIFAPSPDTFLREEVFMIITDPAEEISTHTHGGQS